MIYETYTTTLANGGLEYGFCFKREAGQEDTCAPDIVISQLGSACVSRAETSITKDWAEWEWMAQAVCEAAAKRGL